MKEWFNRNSKNVIIVSYIIPILIASILSISHVVAWYDITNPMSWAVYLSIGIEIAALSALAGIVTKVNKYVYIPFIIVTFIQFVGNVFYGYQYIDVDSQLFKDWVELTAPLFDWLNLIEPDNIIAHKRLLAFIGGGLIPVISLSFLHLLVTSLNEYEKVEEKSENEKDVQGIPVDEEFFHEDDDIISEPSDSEEKEDEKGVVLSGKTNNEVSDEKPNYSATTSGSTSEEKKKDESDKNDKEKPKKGERRTGIKKEDLPEVKNKKKKNKGKKGSSNIQRVDDYDRKRTH